MAAQSPNPSNVPDGGRGTRSGWAYWGETIAGAIVISVCGLIANWVNDSVEHNRELMLERSAAIEERLDRLEERLIFLEQQRMTTPRIGGVLDNEHINQSTPGN